MYLGASFKGTRVDWIQAYGFLGCPFCHRAVEAGNALAAEIKDESVFTFHGEEMVWRVLRVLRRSHTSANRKIEWHLMRF